MLFKQQWLFCVSLKSLSKSYYIAYFRGMNLLKNSSSSVVAYGVNIITMYIVLVFLCSIRGKELQIIQEVRHISGCLETDIGPCGSIFLSNDDNCLFGILKNLHTSLCLAVAVLRSVCTIVSCQFKRFIFPYLSGIFHWYWNNHACPDASEATLKDMGI